MEKNNFKKVVKLFVAIYLLSFLVINWNDVSWIFNYKEMSGLVSDFFNPYPSIDASYINAYFYPNRSHAQALPQEEAKYAYTFKLNALEIPKIGIEAPMVFSTSTEKQLLAKDLDTGVVYYPGSVYPGQSGQIVILGHSAPVGWPKVKYDWIFSEINKLEAGDKILIDLNNKQYTYIVKSTKIIQKGAEVPQDGFSPDSSVLTLISCWPPGKDYQRIAVQAVLAPE